MRTLLFILLLPLSAYGQTDRTYVSYHLGRDSTGYYLIQRTTARNSEGGFAQQDAASERHATKEGVLKAVAAAWKQVQADSAAIVHLTRQNRTQGAQLAAIARELVAATPVPTDAERLAALKAEIAALEAKQPKPPKKPKKKR
jgi:hypothetical protein